jgi:hypothetical protein
MQEPPASTPGAGPIAEDQQAATTEVEAMELQFPRYLSAREFQAVRYLADAVRAEYPAAACVHVASPAEGRYAITEVRDGDGVVLAIGGRGPLFDGSPVPYAALLTALNAVGTSVTEDERCTQCVLAVSLPGAQRTALESWRGQVEKALEVDRDEIGVFLWDARSTDNNYEAVGGGVVHVPAGTDLDAAAAQLRVALERITGDWSVGVRLTPRDHDGERGSGGVGVSEPWDNYESPNYDIDDEYDGRTAQNEA